MKKIMVVMLLILFMVPPAFGDNKTDAVKTLQKSLDAVKAVLDDEALTLAMKKTKLVDTVAPMFDFRLMSMLTLGRDNWIQMTDKQRDEFVDAYINLLKKSFIDKVSLYDNQKIEFFEAAIKQNKVSVPTRIVSDDKQIAIEYRLYQSKQLGWVIYDVIIQDISVIGSYTSQIRSLMEKGGYDTLITKINSMVNP